MKIQPVSRCKCGENAGDVLATFEIFWTSKKEIDDETRKLQKLKAKKKKPDALEQFVSDNPEDIPFDPPQHPGGDGYQVDHTDIT